MTDGDVVPDYACTGCEREVTILANGYCGHCLGALRSSLSEAADDHAPSARVLRYVEGREVSTRPEDFYSALKRCPDLVVRLDAGRVGETLLPVDCRVRNGAVEFTHEHRDTGEADRDVFVEDVREADEVVVVPHSRSRFGDEDAAEAVRADGGTTVDEREQPAPEDDSFACSLCGCYLGERKRLQGDEYCDACQHDTEDAVVCETCGDRVPRSRATGVDVSSPDEYYPEYVYFCPTHAPDSGESDDHKVRADGGTASREFSRPHAPAIDATCPMDLDGIDLNQGEGCPHCGAETDALVQHPAGHYHCQWCWAHWAGDRENATLHEDPVRGPAVDDGEQEVDA